MYFTLVQTAVLALLSSAVLANDLTLSAISVNWPSEGEAQVNPIAPWLDTVEMSAFGASIKMQLSSQPKTDSQLTFTVPKKPRSGAPLITAGVLVAQGEKTIAITKDMALELKAGDTIAMVIPAPQGFEGLPELIPADNLRQGAMDMFTMNKGIPRVVFTAQVMAERVAMNQFNSYTIVGIATPGEETK